MHCRTVPIPSFKRWTEYLQRQSLFLKFYVKFAIKHTVLSGIYPLASNQKPPVVFFDKSLNLFDFITVIRVRNSWATLPFGDMYSDPLGLHIPLELLEFLAVAAEYIEHQ